MLNNRQKVIDAFKTGIFSYKDGFKKEEESEEESEEKKLKKIKDDFKKFIEYIENESKGINYDLFKDYFDLVVPSALAKKIYETKKNNELVELIKVRWSNLKDDIEKMTEDEIKNERPYKILEIIKEILDFNKKIRKQQVWG